MKNIFKVLMVTLIGLFIFSGCNFGMDNNTPEEVTEAFFEKYRSKDDNVIEQLKDVIKGENLTDDQNKKYEELMEKQYESLGYVVKDVKEKDNQADVTVEITVLNYRNAVIEAENELEKNPDKFNDDEGKFSEEKYMNYKIEKMNSVQDTTTHTLELTLTKESGMWHVNELSKDDISKIHGLY